MRTGLTLSVDPGTNLMGLSLWSASGDYIKSGCLKASSATLPYAIRVKEIYSQLDGFFEDCDKITAVVTEGVQSKMLMASVGSVFVHPLIIASFSDRMIVSPSTWKKWARKNGCTEPDFKKIKGVAALEQTGWLHDVDGDDAADSIMIYLAWRAKTR